MINFQKSTSFALLYLFKAGAPTVFLPAAFYVSKRRRQASLSKAVPVIFLWWAYHYSNDKVCLYTLALCVCVCVGRGGEGRGVGKGGVQTLTCIFSLLKIISGKKLDRPHIHFNWRQTEAASWHKFDIRHRPPLRRVGGLSLHAHMCVYIMWDGIHLWVFALQY